MERDHAAVSYWLETARDDLTPRPPLDGSTTVDVAILGGGYTGLWTARQLLARDPGRSVLVVEREICGFGASGRNGAWCAPDLNISTGRLAELHGADAARRIQQATYDAVEEVGRATVEDGIDAGYQVSGELLVARGPGGVPALDAAYEEYVRFGFGDRYELLDERRLAERIRIAGATRGLRGTSGAVVHPGRLVRGLARAVERRGGRIVEGTTVTAVRPRRPGAAPGSPEADPVLVTDRGEIRASTVVLAGEAYLTRLPAYRRRVVPLWSLIVLTEPLPDAAWEEIGWAGRELLASTRLSIDYLSRTEDGRILFGGRGAPYRFGSPIRDAYDRHDPTHALLRDLARAWFPALRDLRFTHAWGGPLGMPRDWHPSISYDRARGIAIAGGYTGHGVSTANLAGRTLADLIDGVPSPLTELPLVGHRSPDWEPEPLRWLGVRYTQWAMSRLDRRIDATGIPPTGRSLAERLARR